jgi:hypothetical protein
MSEDEGLHTQRNINYRERKGSGFEYPVTKDHLDFILDGVRHMPDPGKLIQPLGWFLLGVAATAALEAYNAVAGTDHRHIFAASGAFAAVAGLICLYCDRKLNKESRKHAKWLEKYVVDLYGQFSLEAPPPEPGLLKRCWEGLLRLRSGNAGPAVALPAAPSPPRLVISSAVYGVAGSDLDVTTRLNGFIRDDVLDIIADNATMGADPAEGVGKTLRLRWTFGDQSDASSFLEGTHVVIPNPRVQE